MNRIKNTVLLIITATIFFMGCNKNEEPSNDQLADPQKDLVTLKNESIKQIGLETELVTPQPYSGYLTIPAKVITNQNNEAQIGSLVQGRVYKVFANIGDYVKAGQVLMKVEGLEIGEIKANYLKAKANLEFMKADYERHKSLFEQNIGSKQNFYEAKAEYEKAAAEFDAEDKKIHSIGLEDNDVLDESKNDEHTSGTLPIKASINGIIVQRNVVIGQLVDATTTAFTIINNADVWVDGQIYEKDIDKVTHNTSAQFTSTTYPNEVFNGKIIYVGQIVDEQTRTITIRSEFLNRTNKLKPQMFGELKIPVGINTKAILIKDKAVFTEAGQTYVFVQTNDSTFIKKLVVLGSRNNSLVEIKEGLNEGDRVVVKGAFYLKSELKKDDLEGD